MKALRHRGAVAPRRVLVGCTGLLALLAIVGMLTASPGRASDLCTDFSCSPSEGAFSDASTPQVKFQDWMAWVANGTSLSALTIPGTHDSVSLNGGQPTQTQSLCNHKAPHGCDVTAQLDSGIRAFDLRPDCLAGHHNGHPWLLELYHGGITELISLDTLVTDTHSWLTKHPTETVLIMMQHEGLDNCKQNAQDTTELPYFLAAVHDYVYKWHRNYFWLPKPNGPVPVLSQATRGKIIPLVTRGGVDQGFLTTGCDSELDKKNGCWLYDVDTTRHDHYSICSWGQFNNHGCPDHGKPGDNNGDKSLNPREKTQELASHLNADQSDYNSAANGLHLTFASGTGVASAASVFNATSVHAFHYLNPLDVARGDDNSDLMNRGGMDYQLFNHLVQHPGLTNLGAVMTDFPGPGLLSLLVTRNVLESRYRGLPFGSPHDLDTTDSTGGAYDSGYNAYQADFARAMSHFATHMSAEQKKCGSCVFDGTDAAAAGAAWNGVFGYDVDRSVPHKIDVMSYNSALTHVQAGWGGVRSPFGTAAYECPNLCARAFGPRFTYLIFDTNGEATPVTSANIDAVVAAMSPSLDSLAAKSATRGEALLAALRARYPGTSFAAAAAPPAGDLRTSGWHSATHAFTRPDKWQYRVEPFAAAKAPITLTMVSRQGRVTAVATVDAILAPGETVTVAPVKAATGSCVALNPSPTQGGLRFTCTLTSGAITKATSWNATFSGGGYVRSTSSAVAPEQIAPEPTSTSVSCAYGGLRADQATPCTVTVADLDANPAAAPAGQVTLTAPSAATLSAGSCTLAAVSTSTSSCRITLTQTAAATLNAAYVGDPGHTPSSGQTAVPGPVSVTLTCPSASSVREGSSLPVSGTESPASAGQPITVDYDSQIGAPESVAEMTAATSAGTWSVSLPGSFTSGHPQFLVTASSPGDSTHRASQPVSCVVQLSLEPTSTTVSCAYGGLRADQATPCTVTVADLDANPVSAPAGQVTLTAPSGATLSAGSCTLTAVSASASNCQITLTQTATATLTAAYGGDAGHAASSGQTDVPGPVTVTITCPSDSSVQEGTALPVSGTESPASAGQPITVTYTSQIGTTQTVTDMTAATSTGTWSDSLPGSFTAGHARYQVSASSAGDSTHRAAGNTASCVVTLT